MENSQTPWQVWPERTRMLCRIRDLAHSVGISVDLAALAQQPLGDLEMLAQRLEYQDHVNTIKEMENDGR